MQEMIWPNRLLPINQPAPRTHVMINGMILFAPVGGGEVPLLITEPAIVAMSSGITTDAAIITADTPARVGGQNDMLIAILGSDGTEASYIVPNETGWTKHQSYSAAASQSIWYKVADSEVAESLTFETGGTTESMGLFIFRVSGVDNNEPFNRVDSNRNYETIVSSGIVDRQFTADANINYNTITSQIKRRNTLSIVSFAVDRKAVPGIPVPVNGWTQEVVSAYGTTTTVGAGNMIYSKLITEGMHNWIPNEAFDEGDSTGFTRATIQLLINPSGVTIRPTVYTPYPDIAYMEVNKNADSKIHVLNHPSGLEPNDILYYFVAADRISNGARVHDASGYWQVVDTRKGGGSSEASISIFSKVCIGDGSEDDMPITFEQAGNEDTMTVLLKVSGVDPANRVDASGFLKQNTIKPPWPAVTTLRDNSRILYFGAAGGVGTSVIDNYNWQRYNKNAFGNDSVSGIMGQRGGSQSMWIGTTVKETAGLVESGTLELYAANQPSLWTLSLPPATGAVSSAPYIVTSGLADRKTSSTFTAPLNPNETLEEGDLLVLIGCMDRSALFTTASISTAYDDGQWILAGQAQTVGTTGPNIGVWFRRANREEFGNIVQYVTVDGGFGSILVFRGAEGIGNVTGDISPSATTLWQTPEGIATHNNTLMLHCAVMVSANETMSFDAGQGLTEIFHDSSSLNGPGNGANGDTTIILSSTIVDAGEFVPVKSFITSAAKYCAGLTIPIKPLVVDIPE